MTRTEVPTLTDDLPDLPYRLALDDTPTDRWEITADEDERIARAARPDIVTRALAGDAAAIEDMQRLHMTFWQHDRGVA